jgi:hypothetical protein
MRSHHFISLPERSIGAISHTQYGLINVVKNFRTRYRGAIKLFSANRHLAGLASEDLNVQRAS